VQWGRGKRPLKEFFHQLDVGEGRFLYHMIAQYNLVIVAKRLKDEYVVICSNNQNPETILKTYRKRWDIERCFKNMKSQGFNLENTHMTALERLMKLMCVVAVAILVASLMGLNQQCPFKKTVKSPLYSFFTRGLRFLSHNILLDNIMLIIAQNVQFAINEG
jgi:hypothetical protein